MKLVHWIATLPAAVVLVIFSVANRQDVTLSFWPLAESRVPLYLVVLLALLLGFLAGEFVAWANGGRARRLARERGRRLSALERELAATQAMAAPVGGKQNPAAEGAVVAPRTQG